MLCQLLAAQPWPKWGLSAQAEHLLPATFDVVACLLPTLKTGDAPDSGDTMVLALITAGR